MGRPGVDPMGWLLIFFVMLLLASGLPGWMRKIGLGRLPGDIRLRIFGREVQVPLASALLLRPGDQSLPM